MKKSYKIEVDCANCANLMEKAALKMFVEFEEGAEPEKVMKDVLKACRKVEPDCEIFM